MHRDIQCRVKLLIDIFDILFFSLEVLGILFRLTALSTPLAHIEIYHPSFSNCTLYTVDLISDHQQDVGRQSTMDGDNAVFR